MIKVGITGGIGAGKSLICDLYKVLKVPVYNSDQRAKHLLYNDPDILKEVASTFGEEVFENGALSRNKLAEIVFNAGNKLKKLNAIIHPAVRSDFKTWCDAQKSPYVIQEAAILVETGGYKNLDKLILVTAPEKVRIKRIQHRDGTNVDQIKARMVHQLSDEEKRKLTDFEIVNDGDQMLIPQVMNIHHQLIKL